MKFLVLSKTPSHSNKHYTYYIHTFLTVSTNYGIFFIIRGIKKIVLQLIYSMVLLSHTFKQFFELIHAIYTYLHTIGAISANIGPSYMIH